MMTQGEFKKEKENLLMLNSSISRHNHIIKYLGIMIVGDEDSSKEFNILMPLATMNLEQFLYQDPDLTPKFVLKDLLVQSANIANAVLWLHSGLHIKDRVYVCCHMDLKLDNFLVFLDAASEDDP